jgi:hypothetical protein
VNVVNMGFSDLWHVIPAKAGIQGYESIPTVGLSIRPLSQQLRERHSCTFSKIWWS